MSDHRADPDQHLRGNPSAGHGYWNHAHQDWKFYLAVALMLVGILSYVATLDFSVRPDLPPNAVPQTPVP